MGHIINPYRFAAAPALPDWPSGVTTMWEFEEDLVDEVSSNHLTAAGAGSIAYASALGNLGKGAQFDGAVRLEKASPVGIGYTDKFSVGIVATIPATTAFVFLMDRLGAAQGFGLFVKVTTSVLRATLNGGLGAGESSAAIDTGSPIFLMLTYDKDAGGTDEGKLYINNGADGTIDYSTAIDFTPDPNLAIGGAYGAATNYLPNNSIVYQAAYWGNKVLSSQEKSDWYNGGSGNYRRKRLVGANRTLTGNANHNTGFIYLTRFQASGSGVCDMVNVYAGSASTTGKVAIYDESGGEPNNLLGEGSASMTANQWNAVPLDAGVSITDDDYYWLGVRVSAINGAQYNNASGTMRYKALAHASAWPDPAGSGYTSDSFYSALGGYIGYGR